jgi:hypothetical protein
MGRILISEEEKQRILGMHVENGYSSFINEQQQPKTTTFNPPSDTPNSKYLGVINNILPEVGITEYTKPIQKDSGVLNGISEADFAILQKGLVAYNNYATNKINLPIAMQNWKEWYSTNLNYNVDAQQAMTDEQYQKANQIWTAESEKLKNLRPSLIEVAKYATSNPNLDIQNLTVNSPDYEKKNAFKKAVTTAVSGMGIDYSGLKALATTGGGYGPIGGNGNTRAWFPNLG